MCSMSDKSLKLSSKGFKNKLKHVWLKWRLFDKRDKCPKTQSAHPGGVHPAILIESEKEQAKEGWSGRVKYLEEAKQEAELIPIMKDINDIDH